MLKRLYSFKNTKIYFRNNFWKEQSAKMHRLSRSSRFQIFLKSFPLDHVRNTMRILDRIIWFEPNVIMSKIVMRLEKTAEIHVAGMEWLICTQSPQVFLSKQSYSLNVHKLERIHFSIKKSQQLSKVLQCMS